MWRERGLKVVLMLVGLLFSAAIYPAIGGLSDPAHSDTGDTTMMGLYFALGIFPAHGGAQSIGASQPDHLRSLVEPRSRRVMSILGFEIATERAGFLVGVGCACCHRRSPDSVGSGKGARRTPSSTNCIRD